MKTSPSEGSWRQKLDEALHKIGFHSLEQFLGANPGTPYSNLAKKLGEANFAPLQIYGEAIRDGCARGEVLTTAKDSFVRFLNEHLKHGWNTGVHSDFRFASAASEWMSAMRRFCGDCNQLVPELESVIERLKATGPQKGWSPDSTTDEIIASVFSSEWKHMTDQPTKINSCRKQP